MHTAFPRGSEWRRWDLHIHTPFSAMNNGFGDDFSAYAKCVIETAVQKGIAVVGVTDYFCIEGYRQFRELLADDARLRDLVGDEIAIRAARIRFLPNIEFRLTTIVTRNGQDSRVNLNVIFSEEVTVDDIEEHFLRTMRFTAESSPSQPDELWPLSVRNLTELGRRLKLQHAHFHSSSDLTIGMLNAIVSHEEITRVLTEQRSRFKDKALLVLPADEDLSHVQWNGQGHLARKLLLQKSHMLFSSNAGTRAFGLGLRHPTVDSFVKEFGSLKACIHGSDAHDPTRLFAPAEGRQLWVKADPGFLGLRQLLHEPDSRVHIGAEPPSVTRVRTNATKYIGAVTFNRVPPVHADQQWFNGTLPLNAGLVAIIGNKGSGKSALADIIALAGATSASQYFSFLRSDRFLDPKLRLGDRFSVTLEWISGQTSTHLLKEKPATNVSERVKYIPQNYLEIICTELKEPHESTFDRELTEVIFSHVEESERLGKTNLRELIGYVTEERERAIGLLQSEVSDINKEIVHLEGLLQPEHRLRLESQLAQLQAELQSHLEAKPVEVPIPEQDAETQVKVAGLNAAIVEAEQELARISASIDAEKAALSAATMQTAAAERLTARVANFERQYKTFCAESADDVALLGIAIDVVMSISTSTTPIIEASSQASQRASAARQNLNADEPGSPAAELRDRQLRMEELKTALDEPNQLYQRYREQLAAWETRRATILGDQDTPASVSGIMAEIQSLTSVPDQLAERKVARARATEEIFENKRNLLEDYDRLYAPVQRVIDEHPVSSSENALTFAASIALVDFASHFLGLLHKGRIGSFYGEEEGLARVKAALKAADLSDINGVMGFIDLMSAMLEADYRTDPPTPTSVRSQLRQDVEVEDAYDYLYGLEYLQPRFELRWLDKPIDQLSPGERGSMLLMFYLLVDNRDIPLLIDQPEENLDNQTVAKALVPALKYAKGRRQIIMVTHNPNLAVVCDADQIIHSDIERLRGNTVSYTAGAIEDPVITQLVVDVLEGTKPAFDLRDARYDVLE